MRLLGYAIYDDASVECARDVLCREMVAELRYLVTRSTRQSISISLAPRNGRQLRIWRQYIFLVRPMYANQAGKSGSSG